jgi:hypothetical protein
MENLGDIIELNKIIGNDKLEGNCLYHHYSNFKIRRGIDCENLRYNLFKLGELSNTILEIGFNAGHSASIMINGDKSIKFTTIDIGRHPYTKKCVEYMQQKYQIEYLEGNSRNILPNYNPGRTFDLIHIDGCHGVVTAIKDILNCKKLANMDTLVLIDDIDNINIKNLVNKKIEEKYLKEIDGILLGLKPTKYHKLFKYIF